MLEPITIPCRFCDGKRLPDEIPIQGNVDTRRSVCIIAQGVDKKQIVLNANVELILIIAHFVVES